jgi:hypothetical protein
MGKWFRMKNCREDVTWPPKATMGTPATKGSLFKTFSWVMEPEGTSLMGTSLDVIVFGSQHTLGREKGKQPSPHPPLGL